MAVTLPTAAAFDSSDTSILSVSSQQSKDPAPGIRSSVINVDHSHIYSMVEAVRRGGGTLVSFYAPEADLAAEFGKRFKNDDAANAMFSRPQRQPHLR
jgi:hypothetical protein